MTNNLAGFDVLVVGGGNAAMAAALSARENGASVLVLEAAPQFYRAGTVGTPGIFAACTTHPRM